MNIIFCITGKRSSFLDLVIKITKYPFFFLEKQLKLINKKINNRNSLKPFNLFHLKKFDRYLGHFLYIPYLLIWIFFYFYLNYIKMKAAFLLIFSVLLVISFTQIIKVDSTPCRSY